MIVFLMIKQDKNLFKLLDKLVSSFNYFNIKSQLFEDKLKEETMTLSLTVGLIFT